MCTRAARPVRLVSLVVLACAQGAGAQENGTPVPAGAAAVADTVSPRLFVVDSLYRALDPKGSLTVADALVRADSADVEAHWRAARAALVLGVMATSEAEQNDWFRSAEAYGTRAAALAPRDPDVLYWLAAAKGRLALQQGPRATAALAQEVWDLSHRVLALDPHHAGAHNILGKLDYEVMTLSRIERFLARLILGNEALHAASWEGAEEHHRKAVSEAPGVILFRWDLAQTYLRRGMRAEAEAELHALLALPVRQPPDPLWREDARRALDRIEGAR